MSSSAFNSSALVNHSSPGPRPLLWYKHEMCGESPYAYVFSYLVKAFNMAVGIPTNFMVVWQLARKKSDSSTSDIFILNLAIIDAYFCLMTPSDIANRLLLNNKNILHFQRFAYGMKDTTPLFLTCICLDRYMAVVHPIVFSSIRDNKIRLAVSMLIWGLMISYALTKTLVGVDFTVKIYSGLILSVFTIMVFCNISIIWTLRKSVIGKEKMHPVKKKALRMVVITLAIIVFTYLPPVALFPFAEYYSLFDYKCHIKVVVFSFMDLSSSIEPLLYISKMDHCTVKLPCSCCKSPPQESKNESS